MNAIKISVMIPAYNEEKNIESILTRTEAALKALKHPYEILVVDDGSTDETSSLARKKRVIVIKMQKNRGKGFALRKAFQQATGDILITMDADGSHRPEEIPRLVTPLLNGIDVATGARFNGEMQKGSTKKLHVMGNSIFNLIIMILTRKRITDSQTGFRAIKKRVMKEIKLFSNGYEVETELTIKTLKNGFTVYEAPIAFEKRKNGISRINPLFDGLKIMATMLKAYIN
jgi:glycosyltransferase involved in cell wall biosynthesis